MIPYFPEEPFDKSIIRFLDEKSTTRKDVISILGEPNVLDYCKTVIYEKEVIGAGMFGYNTYDEFNEYYFLSIDFDKNDRVAKHEIIKWGIWTKPRICFSNGICFEENTGIAPLAPARYDQEAKKFLAAQNLCTIYFFREISPFLWILPKFGRKRDVFINGILAGHLIGNGYFRWVIEPTSDATIKVFSPEDSPLAASYSTQFKRFDCEKGKVYYFRYYAASSAYSTFKLELVDEHYAKDAISKRKLLLGKN